MRIQTTEQVRRFNAQTELADIALDFAGFSGDLVTDPEELFYLLFTAKHYELAGQFKLAAIDAGYPFHKLPASSPHKVSCTSTESLIYRLEASKAKRTTDNFDGLAQMDSLIDQCCEELKRLTKYREFCANSSRPGDIANLILERDEVRTTLKQCRKALGAALCGTPSEHYFAHVKTLLKTGDRKTIEDSLGENTAEIKRLATAALNRINSIIP